MIWSQPSYVTTIPIDSIYFPASLAKGFTVFAPPEHRPIWPLDPGNVNSVNVRRQDNSTGRSGQHHPTKKQHANFEGRSQNIPSIFLWLGHLHTNVWDIQISMHPRFQHVALNDGDNQSLRLTTLHPFRTLTPRRIDPVASWALETHPAQMFQA